MKATENIETVEAYAGRLEDGSHVAIHTDKSGAVFLREGPHGKLRRITPRHALDELLHAMDNHAWAATGDGFPELRAAILKGVVRIEDAPEASKN